MLTIYIVTAVISIVIAVVLVQVSKLSTQAAAAENERRRLMGNSALAGIKEASLDQVILRQVSAIAASGRPSQEACVKLAEAVNSEITKRVNTQKQELSKKYESVVKEKTQSEEIAWNKYNKVLEDKKNTDAVIRSVAEGLVVVDAQGKVIMMNPAAEKLLGVAKKDKIGKSIYDNLKEEQLVSISKDSADKQGKEIELISRQDETRKTLRASTAVLENENGQTVGMVSVLSDITKQKKLDEMKSSFVASVSHELRTPLVAIDKSISLVLDKSTGELSETQAKFLNIAERNLKRLSVLVNDLLDLSKLEAGKMQLRLEDCPIDKAINDSAEIFSSWAETKGITISVQAQQGLPGVSIDPGRIIQVLNNLIGNAIKFTPGGGSISVGAVFSPANKEIEVSVKDTGPGISPEDLPRVFDKFYQSGERVYTDINGTGIGLTIAKEIVELHKGKIWVESSEGKGTKFIFTLPVLL
jgi:PAS domain S-box-containing protein